jgi:hypothetical protein
MRAAFTEGLRIHVVAPAARLWDEEFLLQLQPFDVEMHVLRDDVVEPASLLLDAVAKNEVRVTDATRADLFETGWSFALQDVESNVKGRRFEAVLAFLFSQIEDFRVVERNYRTSTEELDIVIQHRGTAGRCWSGLGAPIILAEAKNWTAKVGQAVISTLRSKVQGKRGTVRVALIIARSGFTGDAIDQARRFATERETFVLLAPEDLTGLAAAPDIDERMEFLVRRAMLD